MVRYTHDSWKNNAPNLQSNLWGDDPFPAVDSNWDSAREASGKLLKRMEARDVVQALRSQPSLRQSR